METYIYEIASAGRVLVNPVALAITAAGVLGLTTGVAGRVAERVADRSADPRTRKEKI